MERDRSSSSSSGSESINSPQTRKKGAEPEEICSECNTTVLITRRWGTQCCACYFRDRENSGSRNSTPIRSKTSTATASISRRGNKHQQIPPPPLTPSNHHQQEAFRTSYPMATVRLSSEDRHCLEVSNDFITSQIELFQAMPQNPHLKPLEKYPPSARKGMRLMFDLDFTNLAEKLQGSVDPVEFYAKAGEYTWQIRTLEEMGYNVVQLKEKFDKLSIISVVGKAKRVDIEETGEKIRLKEAEASVDQKRIGDLEKKVQQLKADLRSEDEEVETMKLLERELSEEKANKLSAFMSLAKAPWA